MRQQRLGAELRKLRQAAGMTTEHSAGLLGVPRTNIPNMESGRAGISPARVRTLVSHYGCDDAELADALTAMAGERVKGWWTDFAHQVPTSFHDIAELEWHAARIRTSLTVHIPGLLQTEEHARALFDQVIPPLPAADAEARLAHRVARQRVLERKEPASLDATIHEAALHMRFGGRDVARRQLLHLVKMSRRAHVAVRVVPFSAGGFPGAGQSMIYAEGPVPQLDTVELDATHGPVFMDAELQLRKYRAQLARLESLALDTKRSRELLSRIIDDL